MFNYESKLINSNLRNWLVALSFLQMQFVLLQHILNLHILILLNQVEYGLTIKSLYRWVCLELQKYLKALNFQILNGFMKCCLPSECLFVDFQVRLALFNQIYHGCGVAHTWGEMEGRASMTVLNIGVGFVL